MRDSSRETARAHGGRSGFLRPLRGQMRQLLFDWVPTRTEVWERCPPVWGYDLDGRRWQSYPLANTPCGPRPLPWPEPHLAPQV